MFLVGHVFNHVLPEAKGAATHVSCPGKITLYEVSMRT